MHTYLCSALLAGAFFTANIAHSEDWAAGNTNWDRLPLNKQTKLALYLSPQLALARKQAEPKAMASFDIRTEAKAPYLGMPSVADALIPFTVHKES